ncbi:MAG TPA: glycosyltransferase family 2 protein [Terriglobia bacterium]|nr:glycosyltransferase family 2 protein [Terriglobia bacterium]
MINQTEQVALSVVIPVYNESANIQPLCEKLNNALLRFSGAIEFIFVDDGSTDSTLEELRAAQRRDPRIRILRFRENLGQTAAMAAGFHHAQGEAVVTIDGDLQNDPADIPALVEKLKDWDVVCGVRVRRQDSWLKRISSRIANGVRNWATGDDIVDTGCTLKAYRTECVKNLELYQGMHRFLPTLLKMRGFRVFQTPVGHHPRLAGATKYGTWGRMMKGIDDLFAVRWMKKNHIDYRASLEIYDDPEILRREGTGG